VADEVDGNCDPGGEEGEDAPRRCVPVAAAISMAKDEHREYGGDGDRDDELAEGSGGEANSHNGSLTWGQPRGLRPRERRDGVSGA
jgi:hypothetical protein